MPSYESYSVKYVKADRKGYMKVYIKDCKTAAARDKFIEKLVEQDGFIEIVAYADPQ